MPSLPEILTQLVPGVPDRPSLLFSLVLVPHIFAGVTAVVGGATAALSKKRPGRHPGAGRVYLGALSVVFVTAVGMSVIRWPHDNHLFVLAFISFALACVGFTARRVRWRGWRTPHVGGMSLSYIVLLTAFYVDNGPNLPVWNRFPTIAFWVGPSLIGLPIVARALARHTRVAEDLRNTLRFVTRADPSSVRRKCPDSDR